MEHSPDAKEEATEVKRWSSQHDRIEQLKDDDLDLERQSAVLNVERGASILHDIRAFRSVVVFVGELHDV